MFHVSSRAIPQRGHIRNLAAAFDKVQTKVSYCRTMPSLLQSIFSEAVCFFFVYFDCLISGFEADQEVTVIEPHNSSVEKRRGGTSTVGGPISSGRGGVGGSTR